MTAHPTPQTQTDAVNIMIGTIGLAPVNTISGTINADVALAVRILNEVSLSVQKEGWYFNREIDWPLMPDGITGEIALPSNFIKVSIPQSPHFVERGAKLYDRQNRTFTITQALKASVVLSLPWDSLPESAREYITIRAARVFQKRLIGSEALDVFTREDEIKARADLNETEDETEDHNIFGSADYYNIQRIRSDRYHW